jgi:4-hydroxy-tetrahydrodipicolinate synthase
MKNNLQGTGVALVTPFDERKAIDYPALGKLIESVIAGGADYLVALGTTAETPTLSAAEKSEILSFVRERNAGRLPLVVGIGGNNTQETVRKIETTDLEGVAAVLSVTPYYNKPSQEGLYQHYKAVAEASPRPIILYNVPGRTGVELKPETTLRLAHDFEQGVAIKDASCSLMQMAYVLRDKPEHFMVISGDDNMALPLIALGGDGVISVAANVFPEPVCRMVQLCLTGDFAQASLIHLHLMEFVEALFREGNPVGVKAALTLKGMIRNELRLPLVPCSGGLYAHLESLIEKYDL